MNITRTTADSAQIGHYQLLDKLGRGGMGMVYLAQDLRLGRQVAIKCLHQELIETGYRERFKREALLLAKLNHPNIVQIYDFIDSEDQLALVMEYVDGQNLQQHLREQVVPIGKRMQWLVQIAEGLALAHDTGIIHRDLKTENILINKRGDAKISDLGIAKSQDFNATVTDYVTGSYASMSPEQAVGEAIDFKSDLFSFGILAYQLLCGAHPFGDTQNKLQLLQRIISHPPIPPQQQNPHLPAEIAELLMQLLSKNIDKRPDNTHWVAEQLAMMIPLVNNASSDENDTLPLGRTTRQKANLYGTEKHNTFDTRFAKVHAAKSRRGLPLTRTGITTLSLLAIIIIATAVWYFYPKQPHYLAILTPNINTDSLPESQAQLIKSAVFDAVEQGALQLDGYHVIPQHEIANLHTKDSKEDLDILQRATAADEIITTDIQCKLEACRIKLNRLAPDKNTHRMSVKDSKTIDVLTDNYLSLANIVQAQLGAIYSERFNSNLDRLDDKTYAEYLAISSNYKLEGEKPEQLDRLDNLPANIKALPAAQALYNKISLDLHHNTNDSSYLQKAENFMRYASATHKDELMLNRFNLQIAKDDLPAAEKSLETISQSAKNAASLYELNATFMLAKKNYTAAIEYNKKALAIRATADIYYHTSIAYFNSGDTQQAKHFLQQALQLSPNFFNALSFLGTIALLEGDIPTAISSYEQLIAKIPDDSANLSNLGFAYLFDKNYAQALSLFERSFALNPQNIALSLNIADAQSLLGNTEQAQQAYKKIIDSTVQEGKKIDALKALTQAYAHTNQFTDALTSLKELEKLDPQNIETTYTAAIIHTLAKNNASAIFNVDAALKNGMSAVWFNLPWFDSLCSEAGFISLMNRYAQPNRCPH